MSDRAAEMIERARDTMRSWAKVADFLDRNRDIADRASWYPDNVHVCLSHEADPVALLAEYVKRAATSGAQVKPEINHAHSGVKAHFGPVSIYFFGRSEQVCEVAPGTPSLAGPLAALTVERAASSGETR